VELRSDESIADFVKRGDQALYAAKQAGRNCVWHEPTTASHQLDQVMATVATPALPEADDMAAVNSADASLVRQECA
jgi:hypothetical protein